MTSLGLFGGYLVPYMVEAAAMTGITAITPDVLVDLVQISCINQSLILVRLLGSRVWYRRGIYAP